MNTKLKKLFIVFIFFQLTFYNKFVFADTKVKNIDNIWFSFLVELRKQKEFYLIQLRGHKILVLLWNPQNAISQTVLLDIQRVYSAIKRSKKTIYILSITSYQKRKKALQIINKLCISYPCFLIKDKDMELLRIRFTPTILLFNSTGYCVWNSTGSKKNLFQQILKKIDELDGRL